MTNVFTRMVWEIRTSAKVLAFSFLLVALGWFHPVGAQDMQKAVQQFDAGTVALLEGNFQQAISLFGEAERAGWSSPELYYNTGLAYHRINKLGMAILYLERAKSLRPDDAKILHSLSVANHKQADRFSVLPPPFWKKFHRTVLRIFPITVSFWIGFICWTLLVVLWVGYLLRQWRGEWWRRSRYLLAVFALFFVGHALASSAWPPFTPQAVIIPSEVRLRAEASDDAEEIIRVHEGLVVSIETPALDWVYVEIPNGTKGWVPSTSIVGI